MGGSDDRHPDPDETVVQGQAMPSAPFHSWVGMEIAGYTVQDILGRGGMGVVYKAWDPTLERPLALKSIRAEMAHDGKERFLVEARACSRIGHPNIVTVYAAGEQDGHPYLAMELVHGTTLSDLVEESAVEWRKAVRWTMDLLGALDRLHQEGIIHRDLKPHNVMLTEDGVIKLMDFGLAKVESAVTMTAVGASLGTAAYMSPEQAAGQRADARSDLFSTATVLYQLATGRLPFTGEHPLAVMYAIQNTDAPPLATPDAPPELEAVLRKAMARDPDARYQTAAEFRAALQEVVEPGGATPAAPAGRRGLWIGGAVVVLVLAIAGALMMRGGGDGGARDLAIQHNELGQSYEAAGDRDGARAEYRAAIQADDTYAVPFNNLATLAMRDGNWVRADSLLQRSLDLDDRYAAAHFNRGGVLWELGDMAGAEREFRAAIAADPSEVLAYSNLGVLLVEQGRLEDARDALEAGEAVDPNSAPLVRSFGRLSLAEGDTAAAIQFLRRALALSPGDPLTTQLLEGLQD